MLGTLCTTITIGIGQITMCFPVVKENDFNFYSYAKYN
jgi:hypothetical protein